MDHWAKGRFTLRTVSWGQRLAPEDLERVRCNDRILVCGTHSNSIEIFDCNTGVHRDSLKLHTDWVWDVAFDHRHLISASCDSLIMMWDISAGHGRYVSTFFGHTRWVQCVQFDASRVYSGSVDRTVKMWDKERQQCIATMAGHTSFVYCLKQSAEDPSLLFSGAGGEDCGIVMWDIRTARSVRTFSGHKGTVMAIDAGARTLLSGGTDNRALQWDIGTGQVVVDMWGHTGSVGTVHIGPGVLVTGSHDKTVRLWNEADGAPINVLSAHQGVVVSASIDAQRRLTTCSMDMTLKTWDFSQSAQQAAVVLEERRRGGVGDGAGAGETAPPTEYMQS